MSRMVIEGTEDRASERRVEMDGEGVGGCLEGGGGKLEDRVERVTLPRLPPWK